MDDPFDDLLIESWRAIATTRARLTELHVHIRAIDERVLRSRAVIGESYKVLEASPTLIREDRPRPCQALQSPPTDLRTISGRWAESPTIDRLLA